MAEVEFAGQPSNKGRRAHRCRRDAPHRALARLGKETAIADVAPERVGFFFDEPQTIAERRKQLLQFAQAVIDGMREILDAQQRARFAAADSRGQMRRARDFERRAERARHRFDRAPIVQPE